MPVASVDVRLLGAERKCVTRAKRRPSRDADNGLAQTPRRLCSPRPRTLITPRRDSAAACAGPRRPCAKTQFSASRGRPL